MRPREDPPPLRQQAVHVGVQRREGLLSRHDAARRRFAVIGDQVRDLIPLGDLGCRLDVRQLPCKGRHVSAARNRSILPCGPTWRQVRREVVKGSLLGRR